MKNSIITLLLFLLFVPAFSQNSKYEYRGQLMPLVTKEKLKDAQFIIDVVPELWSNLVLPYEERMELEERRKKYYSLGYSVYARGGYTIMLDYVSVEILARCNGKTLIARSTSDKLNTEQKKILNATDLNSDFSIKIKFSYKDLTNNNLSNANKIIEGELAVKIVPETEAKYTGGFEKLSAYLTTTIFDKISDKKLLRNIQQAIVKFTVNENGQVVDAKMSRTSTDKKTDQLIIDAVNKMPKWNPAKNINGIKVKQEFIIPLGNGGC